MRSLRLKLQKLWLGLSDCLTYPGFLFVQFKDESRDGGDRDLVELHEGLVSQRVLAERVRLFADRAFKSAVTAPLGIFLLAWVGAGTRGWPLAASWFAAFTLFQMALARVGFLYRKGEGLQTPELKARARHLVVLNFLAGLGWGSSVWMFAEVSAPQPYLLNLLILVGVAAVSLVNMSPFLSAVVTFFAGLLLLPMLHSLLIPGLVALQISAGLAILYALMLPYASVIGHELLSNIESTMRNELLAERLGLALDAARQDWFDMNPQTDEIIASAKYVGGTRARAEVASRRFGKWLELVHPEDRSDVQRAFSDLLQSENSAEAEYRFHADAGSWRWLRSTGRVVSRDPAGHPLRIIGIHSDVTERKRAEERISRLAFYDHLTDLPNRRLLIDRLQQARVSAARSTRRGAVMLLDMDDFKALNDAHGHDVGDRFLKEVANRLQLCVRGVDTVARLGGDEFVVILEDLDAGAPALAQAERVASKILEAIRQPYELGLAPVQGALQAPLYHGTVSIGITMFSDDAATADELLKQADTAMYQAKAVGRNLIRFFAPRP